MSRVRISLDGPWDFFPDPERRLRRRTLDSASAPRPILVPGPWQAQFDDLHDYSGVAWYRRSFALDGEAGDGRGPERLTYILHFGAVDYHATVWLNGQLLGDHEGGYLPFELPLDAALRHNGPNELVVRV